MGGIKQSTKEALLQEIKDGLKVSEAAGKYGISDKTIYKWLKAQSDNTGTSSLEIAKLRKENQELKELIGIFALDKKRAEKNHKSP